MSNNNQNGKFLEIKNLYMIYTAKSKHASVVALKGASFSVDKGEFLAVVGPSGSGKSSLFNIIGGILKPTAGSVNFEGTDIVKLNEEELTNFRKEKIGFVFQEGNLLPKVSAFENISEAMAFNGVPYEERNKRTLELMKLVGVDHRKNQLAYKLSGGEKQRVAIARALANNPRIIIADEPTGNVDFANGTQILELFKELKSDLGMTFLVATHSNYVAKHAEKTLELRDGMVVGEHGKGVDLSQLDLSRMVMMDSDFRLSLPEHIVESLNIEQGSLWFVNTNDKGEILLSSITSQAKEIPESQPITLMDTETHPCLVCGAENPISGRFCLNCGAKF